MSNNLTLRSPHLVANELDISPATLRRWSDEFTDFLSIGAGASKSRSHRRYTDQDVATLALIKELMNSGLTYEQVRFLGFTNSDSFKTIHYSKRFGI